MSDPSAQRAPVVRSVALVILYRTEPNSHKKNGIKTNPGGNAKLV